MGGILEWFIKHLDRCIPELRLLMKSLTAQALLAQIALAVPCLRNAEDRLREQSLCPGRQVGM